MKRRMVSIGLSVCMVLSVFSIRAARANAGDTITLEKALETALTRNPALSASRQEVAAAGAAVIQASAGYLPQVSASGAYDHTRQDAYTGASLQDRDNDTYTGALSVSQLLYDFGKTPGLVDTSRQKLTANQRNLEAVKTALVRDVKQAYFEALKARRLVDVGNESLDAATRHLAQATALFREGMRPKIDMIRSRVDVSKAELFLVKARYALRTARVALETLMGGSPVSGDYDLAGESGIPKLTEELEPLVQRSLEKRPDLETLKAHLNAARSALLSVRGSGWPSLNAKGVYQSSGTDFPLNDRWSTGLVLKWDLFTGLRHTGEMSEYRANVSRLQSLLEKGRMDAVQEITQAFLKVRESREAIKAAETALSQARENLALVEGSYRAGVSTVVDLSDAQVLYTESKNTLVQARYDYLKAFSQLEYASGGHVPRTE